MPKKTLVKIEEGMTTTSVAYGCAALLDAGLQEQLGPGSPAEEGLDCGGRLAVLVKRHGPAVASGVVLGSVRMPSQIVPVGVGLLTAGGAVVVLRRPPLTPTR